VLTSYRIRGEMSYERIHDALKQWGFVIYGGQGSLVAELFRVSTMGDITDYDMERLLAAIESVFPADG
jgi:2-aminoethylphosphonate-pyruvate transaminase